MFSGVSTFYAFFSNIIVLYTMEMKFNTGYFHWVKALSIKFDQDGNKLVSLQDHKI